MSCTSRFIGAANKTMFRAPITGEAKRILGSAGKRNLVARNTANTRTMSSLQFPSTSTTALLNTPCANPNGNATTPLPCRHKIHIPSNISNRPIDSKNNSHRRSMVTITQTKSDDLAPLFSSHVVDDVSSSSSSAPTYVINEDTNLIVTESCLKQIERLLKQRRARADQPEDHDDGYFLRVFVDAGGCSGFQYQFEVDNELDNDEDVVVVMAKVSDAESIDGTALRPRVVVDETSMGFLEGSTIDYVIEMIKSAFVVSDNPQSESACGCGSSFAMKNFEKFGAKD